jgi:RHS repeat-associated protein
LVAPSDVIAARDGSVYISDTGNGRIRRVAPDGRISTVAGGGEPGQLGDDGPATQAFLDRPRGIALAPDGTLYIADTFHDRVRRVGPDGSISTAAGGGTPTDGLGDGGLATAAALQRPTDVAVDDDGGLYVADAGQRRVRAVRSDGRIETAAGNGTFGRGGDGGPAVAAQLGDPQGLAVKRDGTLLIADRPQHLIRQVSAGGIISTFAGDGSAGFEGELGPPGQAKLRLPQDLAVAADGAVVIADSGNDRVRVATPGLPGFADTAFSIPAGDGTELYQFSKEGRHLRTVSALTGALVYQFAYANDRLISVTDADGLVTSIERGGDGRPVALVAPGGQRTDLAVNPAGYLESVEDPGGHATRFTYEPGGLLKTLTEPNGGVSTFGYDSFGRLLTDESPDGEKKTLSLTERRRGSTVKVTTKLGRETVFTSDTLPDGSQRRVVRQPSGATSTAVTTSDGRLVATEPTGLERTVTMGPDPRWGMAAPILRSEVIETPGGLRRELRSEREVVLQDVGDLLSLTSLTDRVELFSGASPAGTFTTTVTAPEPAAGPDGRWTVTARTAEGRTTTTNLDRRGRVVREQVAGVAANAYTFDSRGRLQTITAGEGASARQARFTFTARDELETIENALGDVARFTYDDAGRPDTKTAFGGVGVTGYEHDGNGNMTSISPPGRPAHTFAFSPGGALETYTAPSVGAPNTTAYSYDGDGAPSLKDRSDDRAVAYGFDAFGRLETLGLARGQVKNSYHPTTGKLVGVTAPGGVGLTLGYDGDVSTGMAWTGPVIGSVERRLDNQFRTASRTVNGANPLAYVFDQDGLLERAGSLELTRDPQNGLLTEARVDTVATSWAYDGFGGPESLASTRGATTLFREDFVRDDAGRITERTETIGGATHTDAYDYDARGRLTEVRRDGVQAAEYTYDANGNRQAGPIAVYDAQDRLTSRGSTTYAYTSEGELARKTDAGGETTYDYDELGNLLAVSLPDGTDIEYLVDGQNRRIGKKVDGALVQGFLWEGPLRPAAELDGSGAVVSRFVYGMRDNVPEYIVRGGVEYALVTDRLGSPRLVVNAATGAIVQRLDYDVFGRVVADTNPGFQPFGFAGGLYDPDSGLVRFGVRDYDAETGRWTTKDPARFGGGDTNLYAYVRNDPVNYVDTRGLWPFPSRLPGTIKDWATQETEKRWPNDAEGNPNPARHNGDGDAFRHCLASCEMAREYGSTIAEALGDAHEFRGDLNGQERGEKEMDKHNNKCGREAAEEAKSAEDCAKGCDEALKNGKLKTYQAGTTSTYTEELSNTMLQIGTGFMTPMGPISVGWW